MRKHLMIKAPGYKEGVMGFIARHWIRFFCSYDISKIPAIELENGNILYINRSGRYKMILK